MKKFTTMSELDILYAAWETMLNRWAKQYDIVRAAPNNKIAQYHEERYQKKVDELRLEILRLEKLK